MDQLALNFTKAQLARDRGIAQTKAHTGEAWFEQALADFVRFVCERGEATVEAWRFDWLTRGMPAPSTHYSYGALGRTAASRGHVVFVKYVKAQAEKTHCHPVVLWRAK